MKRLSILIGLFIGLGVRYLPEIGLESAPGQVVGTTREGWFVVYMIVAVSFITYVVLKQSKSYEKSEETQTESKGVKRIWH